MGLSLPFYCFYLLHICPPLLPRHIHRRYICPLPVLLGHFQVIHIAVLFRHTVFQFQIKSITAFGNRFVDLEGLGVVVLHMAGIAAVQKFANGSGEGIMIEGEGNLGI